MPTKTRPCRTGIHHGPEGCVVVVAVAVAVGVGVGVVVVVLVLVLVLVLVVVVAAAAVKQLQKNHLPGENTVPLKDELVPKPRQKTA